MNRAVETVLHKWIGLRMRVDAFRARRFVLSEAPQLQRAFAAFSRASQISAPRQPLKGYDLWRLLERTRPSSILELGSGTTSAVFALWAQRHGARYRCYEHDARWAEVTRGCLREAGLDAGADAVRVVANRFTADGRLAGFVEPLPGDADFIYVDGPPCTNAAGRKVPNDDVVRLLEAGGAPRAIVIDGRVDTVDYILGHPAARPYAFEPSYVYGLRRGRAAHALHAREHTLLVRT